MWCKNLTNQLCGDLLRIRGKVLFFKAVFWSTVLLLIPAGGGNIPWGTYESSTLLPIQPTMGPSSSICLWGISGSCSVGVEGGCKLLSDTFMAVAHCGPCGSAHTALTWVPRGHVCWI